MYFPPSMAALSLSTLGAAAACAWYYRMYRPSGSQCQVFRRPPCMFHSSYLKHLRRPSLLMSNRMYRPSGSQCQGFRQPPCMLPSSYLMHLCRPSQLLLVEVARMVAVMSWVAVAMVVVVVSAAVARVVGQVSPLWCP